jgi:hypothetical protein
MPRGNKDKYTEKQKSSLPLEELDCALVLLRSVARFERAEVAPLSGFRIFLPRIQPVFA